MIQTSSRETREVACSDTAEPALVVEVAHDTVPGTVAAALAGVANNGGGMVTLVGAGAVRELVAAASTALIPCPVLVVVPTDHDGRRVVEVRVTGRHHDHGPAVVVDEHGSRRVYVRKGDSVVPLAEAAALSLLRHAGTAPDDLRPVAEQLASQVACPERVGRVLRALGITGDRLADLIPIGAAVPWGPDHTLTVAGGVALARQPGRLLPAARIEVRRYPGGVEEVADAALAPATTIHLDDGVEASLDALADLLKPLGVYPGDRTLREVLVNAVVHRSYAPEDLRRPVIVEVFTDGLRVLNPGGALARVGWVDGDGPTGAYRRNPRLAHLLKLLGLAEGQGLGVRRLRQPGRRSGFCAAEFTAVSGSFAVLLRVDPSARVGRPRSAEQPAQAEPARGRRLTAGERDDQVLELLRERGSATRKEIQEALGVSRALVQQILGRLGERGAVVGEGAARSPGRAYRLV